MADDNRGKLSYPEFLASVRQCVQYAMTACGNSPLPDGLATLKTLQSPKRPRGSTPPRPPNDADKYPRLHVQGCVTQRGMERRGRALPGRPK